MGGVVAGIVALLAMAPYVVSILRGTTRPSRTSWLIWAVVALVLLASYRRSGATDTIWLAAAYFVIPVTVLGFSFKYGIVSASALDWWCLLGAAVGVGAWLLFRSAPAALFICIAVDGIGAVPTLRKAYEEPLSEDLRGWAIAFAASVLNLLVVADWSLQISLYPVYSFALTGAISAILYIRRRVLAGEVVRPSVIR